MGKVIIDRRFARQCDVPGCRSRDTVRVRRARGYSDQLFLCKNCISEIHSQVFVSPTNTESDPDTEGLVADASANEALQFREAPETRPKPASGTKKKGAVKK